MWKVNELHFNMSSYHMYAMEAFGLQTLEYKSIPMLEVRLWGYISIVSIYIYISFNVARLTYLKQTTKYPKGTFLFRALFRVTFMSSKGTQFWFKKWPSNRKYNLSSKG